MNKILFKIYGGLFLLCVLSTYLEASSFVTVSPFQRKSPNSMVSEGIYIATNTNTETLAANVRVSSYPAILHAVTINTPGSGSAVEVFDQRVSTSSINRIANIDTTSKVTLLYDVYCSSGISIYNRGTIPADVTVIYWPVP